MERRRRSGAARAQTAVNRRDERPAGQALQGVKQAARGPLPMPPAPCGGAGPGRRGAVAQMGERCNRTAEVRGSIPLSSTSLFNDLAELRQLCTESIRKRQVG